MTEASRARAEILADIRSANRRSAALPPADETWETLPRAYRQTGALSPADCIELLAERLRDYGAGVVLVAPHQVADAIADILRRRNQSSVLVAPDVDPAWLNSAECSWVRDRPLSYEALSGVDGVLTGCTAAIAATGTLCLCHSDSSQGRRAPTLIPDYHLCVVRAGQIVENVPQGMRALEPYRNQPITLISGPSATADIEMTRIQGVHGPRTLDVAIVV